MRDAGYYCPKCIDGYAADFYGKCIKCPSPCATCVIADIQWCLTCLDGSPLVNGRTCGGQTSIPTSNCLLSQYKKSDGLCTNFCSGFYLPESYQGFNCLESCPEGFYPYFNYFSTMTTKMWCNKTMIIGWYNLMYGENSVVWQSQLKQYG